MVFNYSRSVRWVLVWSFRFATLCALRLNDFALSWSLILLKVSSSVIESGSSFLAQWSSKFSGSTAFSVLSVLLTLVSSKSLDSLIWSVRFARCKNIKFGKVYELTLFYYPLENWEETIDGQIGVFVTKWQLKAHYWVVASSVTTKVPHTVCNWFAGSATDSMVKGSAGGLGSAGTGWDFWWRWEGAYTRRIVWINLG